MTLKTRISRLERTYQVNPAPADDRRVIMFARLDASFRCSDEHSGTCPHRSEESKDGHHPVEEEDLAAARDLVEHFARHGIEPSISGLPRLAAAHEPSGVWPPVRPD